MVKNSYAVLRLLIKFNFMQFVARASWSYAEMIGLDKKNIIVFDIIIYYIKIFPRKAKPVQ
ncbi:hypothetical protein DSUL_90084 [Desulfovibrionales bacterium]